MDTTNNAHKIRIVKKDNSPNVKSRKNKIKRLLKKNRKRIALISFFLIPLLIVGYWLFPIETQIYIFNNTSKLIYATITLDGNTIFYGYIPTALGSYGNSITMNIQISRGYHTIEFKESWNNVKAELNCFLYDKRYIYFELEYDLSVRILLRDNPIIRM